MVTLNKELVAHLRRLYTEIDLEMNKPCRDVNMDLVTDNQIMIYDTIKRLVFAKEETN